MLGIIEEKGKHLEKLRAAKDTSDHAFWIYLLFQYSFFIYVKVQLILLHYISPKILSKLSVDMIPTRAIWNPRTVATVGIPDL